MIYSGVSQNSARRPLCWEIRGDSVVNKLVNISFGVRFLSFGWHPLICSPVLAKLIALHAFTNDRKYWMFFCSLPCAFSEFYWGERIKTPVLAMLCLILQLQRLLCVVDWRGDIVPHLFVIISTFLQEFQKVPSQPKAFSDASSILT